LSGRGCSAGQTLSHADGFSFEELVQAEQDCMRTKRNSLSAQEWELHRSRNLLDLFDELQSGAYMPGRSICFVITRPKPREVWAAEFRDRIVHWVLYNRIAPRFHARFIADSCACIPGRGTLYAAERLDHKVRSITHNWSRPAHYLKMDLANFFVSIDKLEVLKQLSKHIREEWLYQLADTILFHDPRTNVRMQGRADLLAKIPPHKSLFNAPSDTGLPIGNLSSQFFANVLLDALDQHVKHDLHCKHYIRYVDDFLILDESSARLTEIQRDVEAWLPANLKLRINPAKTIRQPIDRGVDFVGQVIKPWHRITRRRTFHAAIERIVGMPGDQLFETANSYFGLFGQVTHSHTDRAALANALRRRVRTVKADFRKTYRTSTERTRP
jgi:hypothetical protein